MVLARRGPDRARLDRRGTPRARIRVTSRAEKAGKPAGLVGRLKRLFSPADREAAAKPDPHERGRALLESGRAKDALTYFMRLPGEPRTLAVIFNLGVDFERSGGFEHAAAAYRHILRHDPDFGDAGTRLVHCRSMLRPASGHPDPGPSEVAGAGPAGFDPSVMLGPYRVEKQLGKGAMGVVYLARNPGNGRPVAVKTLALAEKFEADQIDEVKARLFREAKTAGRLSHPNIVSILDAGEAHDLAYIVMEYVAGHDLKKYTPQDALLPLPKVFEIIIQAARALDYAHEQGVVHRDIKPANILFEPGAGKVKITDFGIARMTVSGKTKSGEVLGTPSYMSPEQLAGKEVDGRSDLFSLGVTLYELCTGKLPFHGDNIGEVMCHIASQPHADILSVRPDLPGCLKSIIDTALEKSADDRYSRGADMAGDLMNCAAPLSVSA